MTSAVQGVDVSFEPVSCYLTDKNRRGLVPRPPNARALGIVQAASLEQTISRDQHIDLHKSGCAGIHASDPERIPKCTILDAECQRFALLTADHPVPRTDRCADIGAIKTAIAG